MKKKYIDNFNNYVSKAGYDECWLWTGPNALSPEEINEMLEEAMRQRKILTAISDNYEEIETFIEKEGFI